MLVAKRCVRHAFLHTCLQRHHTRFRLDTAERSRLQPAKMHILFYTLQLRMLGRMAHHLGSTELILDLYLTVFNFLVMFRDSKGEILPMIQARAFTQTTHPNISKGRYLHHHHPPWSGSFTSKAARNLQLGPSKKCWGRTNFSTIWVCNIIIPTNLK